MTQVQAKLQHIPVSPKKAKLVVDLIRGKNPEQAIKILKFTNKKAARYVKLALESAVSNAVNNHNLRAQDLKIIQASINQGRRLKRIKPRARGRADRIHKRYSHIVIKLQSN